MNILLTLGFLLIIGYVMGWLFDKAGLPKIVGYIATGIIFSPNSFDFVGFNIIEKTYPIMEVCLAFIAFEVGGALEWSKIKKHEKEIISITIWASFIPFILMAIGVFMFGLLFPNILPFDSFSLLMLALLLGALASPTEPAATLAVMHQYNAKGKVTETILGVAALDDVLGILIFSLVIAIIFMITGEEAGIFGNPILNSIYEIGTAILIGAILGILIDPISRILKIKEEGQWVVIIFSLIIFCTGISQVLHIDILLSCMTMGILTVNTCKQQKMIFRILERYSEDLIFLFFFLLSGLHLDISTIPQALSLIILFVLLRLLGKYTGTHAGARLVKASSSIQKHTAGGLLPQGGIVIGLVLSIYQEKQFLDIAEILLTTVMGTMVIHELIGPLMAKRSLMKAGEINPTGQNKN